MIYFTSLSSFLFLFFILISALMTQYYNYFYKMTTNKKINTLILLFCISFTVLSDNGPYCDVTKYPGSYIMADPIFSQKISVQTNLSPTKVLLGVQTQLDEGQTVTYLYFLLGTAGQANYDLQIIRKDLSNTITASGTVQTNIPYQTAQKFDLSLIHGMSSGIIGIAEGVAINIKFYALTSASTVSAVNSLILQSGNDATIGNWRQKIIKIITGNRNDFSGNSFYVLTTTNVASLYKFDFNNGTVVGTSVRTTDNVNPIGLSNYITASESALLEISVGSNANPNFYDLQAGTKTTVTAGSTLATFAFGGEIIAMNFKTSFFAGSFNSEKSQVSIYHIGKSASDPPTFSSAATLTNANFYEYWTDRTTSFVLLRKNHATTPTSGPGASPSDANIYFVDSYGSGQDFYKYESSSSAFEFIEDLIALLPIPNKLSFIVDSSDTMLYIYMFKSGANSEIFKYSLDYTDGTSVITNHPTKAYHFVLSSQAKLLLEDAVEPQMYTFSLYCICTKTQVSSFVCFSGVDQCTVVVNNEEKDCSKTTPQPN